MIQDEPNPFDATNSMLGYLYQVRSALLFLIKRANDNPEVALHLEKLDDISFHAEGSPYELLQTKHKAQSGNLTDASGDLWGTFRIWLHNLRTRRVVLGEVSFGLITCGTAATNSAASYLRQEKRDIESALRILNQVAKTSGNTANEEAYALFLSLPPTAQESFLQSVYIFDQEPVIQDLEVGIKRELRWAVDPPFLDALTRRLEGWWFQRIIKHLVSSHRQQILGSEIEAQIIDLRNQFRIDNLPIDDDIVNLALGNESKEMDRIFVQQLLMIGVKNKRVGFAIRDFYRAFAQRSSWLRDGLLQPGELERYENRLREEWEIEFERRKEDVDQDSAVEEKVQMGKDIYHWVQSELELFIRPQCQEPFVMRGTYHMLSDKLRVGWHPEFLDRLKHLLDVEDIA